MAVFTPLGVPKPPQHADMPELPEVDTVRAGLTTLLGTGAVIARLECRRPDLRGPIPADLPAAVEGHRILSITRRAKYLLWDCDGVGLLNHLGMTGSWRLDDGQARDHDHIVLHLSDGRRLIYRDPRRFGRLDRYDPAAASAHPLLANLGPEPLDQTQFHPAHLIAACKGRKTAIKPLIMDQRIVVGVGNIYASEALFRAGIAPTRAAGRVSAQRLTTLVEHIRDVLAEAIAAGGSTIRDFTQAGGSEGYFQANFRVYGRGGEPCVTCGRPLTQAVIGQRMTYWCQTCQR